MRALILHLALDESVCSQKKEPSRNFPMTPQIGRAMGELPMALILISSCDLRAWVYGIKVIIKTKHRLLA